MGTEPPLVSMPSRASTSLLRPERRVMLSIDNVCQCPHGLVPHCYGFTIALASYIAAHVSMPSRASTSLLREQSSSTYHSFRISCQCPHGLVPHCYSDYDNNYAAIFVKRVNALTG